MKSISTFLYSVIFCLLLITDSQALQESQLNSQKKKATAENLQIRKFIFTKLSKAKGIQLRKTALSNSGEIVLIKYDSTIEGILTISNPSGSNDYFAVRYEIPGEIKAPYIVAQVSFFNNDSQTIWPLVLVTQANENGHPDLNNPIVVFNNVSGGPNLGFLDILTNTTVDNLDDIFFVIKMPPGEGFSIPPGEGSGPAIGADVTMDSGHFPGHLYSTDGQTFLNLNNFNLGVELTIGNVAVSGLVFHVERSTGNVFAQGSFIPSGADLAEHIKVSELVEPGDVVELDPTKPGFYRKARGESHLVAGIITSEPGFTLGNRPKAKNETADQSLKDRAKTRETMQSMLALMGRVPVKATTENGPIRIGDLLIVSSKPGYAMRCFEIDSCDGTIIGKALEGLEKGKGKILVLVMAH